jgi:LysR family nitrogen assimilation transcriptional regulator
MEVLLGVQLLHRYPRGVTPTEAGLRLLGRARIIEAEFQALWDHVRGASIPEGEVRFGMPATINEQLGAAFIEAGRRLYPKVRIRISEAMSGFVLGWLREGTVDLAMLYNVADEKGLSLYDALTEEIHLFSVSGLDTAPRAESPVGRGVALATHLAWPRPWVAGADPDCCTRDRQTRRTHHRDRFVPADQATHRSRDGFWHATGHCHSAGGRGWPIPFVAH